MSRIDLVTAMAASSGWTKVGADRALRAFLESVRTSLKRGQPVTLVGFGTFSVTRRKPRKGKNPRTGQPMLDPEAAREFIDMLDALHEKTKGNLAPEEDNMLLDLLGKLKMTFLEINQAVAAEAAKGKAKTRP